MSHHGVFNQYEHKICQINLIHLHGSVYWKNDKDNILVDYTQHKPEVALLNEDQIKALQPVIDKLNSEEIFDPPSKDPLLDQNQQNVVFKTLSEKVRSQFQEEYNKKPIVNPTKWKFHETVYEEHYYQMLRLLSYELEKKNVVLIAFGFSFADEHILNLVKRPLSNPTLQVFICCYSKNSYRDLQEKFKGYSNVQYVCLAEGKLNFTAFNKQVFSTDTHHANTQDSENLKEKV